MNAVIESLQQHCEKGAEWDEETGVKRSEHVPKRASKAWSGALKSGPLLVCITSKC